MELDAEEFLVVAADARAQGAAAGDGAEAGGDLVDTVAVGEQHTLLRAHASEDWAVGRNLDLLLAVLALVLGLDGALEMVIEHLHAVAYAEHGKAAGEKLRVVRGRVCGVGAARATADDHRAVAIALELGNGDVEGDDLAADLHLAHAAVDHLAVLGPGVEDGHPLHAGLRLRALGRGLRHALEHRGRLW